MARMDEKPIGNGKWKISVAVLVCFAATASAQDFASQLWKSDGTPDGTVLVKDSLSIDTDRTPFVNADGVLFFISDNQLWTSDGTSAGTYAVSPPLSNPGLCMIAIGSRVYFSAATDTQTQIWTSDGTAAGTVLVQTFPIQKYQSYFASIRGLLCFSLDSQIWVSDGTPGAAVLVAPTSVGPPGFVPANGELLYNGSDGTTGGIWRTDGTPGGTASINSRVSMDAGVPDNSVTLLNINAAPDDDGSDLWRSDGTAAGTQPVTATPPTFRLLGAAGGYVFIEMATATANGPQFSIWKSDGTADGTSAVADIPESVSDYADFDGELFFVQPSSMSLWKSDGTSDGTAPVLQGIDQGAGSPYNGMGDLTSRGINLFFSTNVLSPAGGGPTAIAANVSSFPVSASRLWKSDGTGPGTVLVKDFDGYQLHSLTNSGGTLFFAATPGVGINGNPINITSVAAATPNPAAIGQTVTFTVAANDAAGAALNYAWSFGDGLTASGPTVSHVFETGGSYRVVATITDSAGASVSSGTIAVVLPPMRSLKAVLSLNGNGADSCTIAGKIIDLPADFAPANATVTLQISNVQRSFTLDENGTASDENGSFTIRLLAPPRKKAAQPQISGAFTGMIGNADYSSLLDLAPAARRRAMKLNITLTISGDTYEGVVTAKLSRRK